MLRERERPVVLPAHETERADEAFADVDELAAAQAAPLPSRVGALGDRVGDDAELRALGPLVHRLLELDLEVDFGPAAGDCLCQRDLVDRPAVEELAGRASVVGGQHARDVRREAETVARKEVPQRVRDSRPRRRGHGGRRAELGEHDLAVVEARLERGDRVDASVSVVREAREQAACFQVGAPHVGRAFGGRRTGEHERPDDDVGREESRKLPAASPARSSAHQSASLTRRSVTRTKLTHYSTARERISPLLRD